MRKAILPLIILLVPCLASAWGPTGHRVVGYVAQKYLSKKARKAVSAILGGESLAIASTWMDEIKSDTVTYGNRSDWHWVTIPDGMTYDQTEKNPRGDAVEAVRRIITGLQSHALSAADAAEYLRMLIHLVGDLHQPLHVGRGTDEGGNKVKVKWFGDDSNLHRVWDSDMIDETKLSYTELAESLGTPDKETVRKWQQADVLDWAAEDISYREQVYAIGDGRLGYRYQYDNLPLVKQRLLQAGIRLAGILNRIYG